MSGRCRGNFFVRSLILNNVEKSSSIYFEISVRILIRVRISYVCRIEQISIHRFKKFICSVSIFKRYCFEMEIDLKRTNR